MIATALTIAKTTSADELEPSPELVTERHRALLALWDTLMERIDGLRVRVDEQLLTSGEFDGARIWWLRSGVALEGGTALSESVHVGVSPSFAWERLAAEGDEKFVVGRGGRDTEITDFLDTSLRVGASYDLDERWGLEGVAGFSARHETGADYGEALQAGGSFAIQHRRGRWLRLRLGLGLGSDLDDNRIRLSPVYRVVIRPTEGWTLESSGLTGSIQWDATPRTALSLAGGVQGSQYKLASRRDPPSGPGDGTLQRRQAQVELEWRHRYSSRLRLRAGVGLVLDEELSVFDEDGVELDRRRERDPSATLRLGFDLTL